MPQSFTQAATVSDAVICTESIDSRFHIGSNKPLLKRIGMLLLDHRSVANAGHFSFLDPFPGTLTKAEFPPSQDPPGFDRERYHETLAADVLAFLQRVL